MVENSLGRLWLEGHPNDDLKKVGNFTLKMKLESDVKIN